MNIAIDLEGTADSLPVETMAAIVKSLHDAGCRVFMVSSRSHNEKDIVSHFADHIGIARGCVVCTRGAAKRWFCEQLGLKIDVWIDDDPGSIENGK